jgi:hypothetical protein
MAKKKTGKKKAPPEPTVYIGPNLPGGTLASFTVFKNGLPARVQEMKKQTPELAHLFVPVPDLGAARRRLARHGKEARAFRAVVKKYF